MSTFLEIYESLQSGDRGGRSARRYAEANPRAMAGLLDILERHEAGDRRAAIELTESMSTDDFPLLFGDVIDRALRGSYAEWPGAALNVCRQTQVRDFRNANRFAVDGAEGVLPQVPELAEYPERSTTDARDQVAVDKYGAVISYSWESIINDDLGGLSDQPARHGRAARRSEERFATELFVDAGGPHADLYVADAGGGIPNIIDDNPPLSTDGIQEGLTLLAQQVDEDGEPIIFEGAHLVVPTALGATARRILDTTEFRVTDADGNVRILRGNGIDTSLQLQVAPYISLIADDNGDTSWFLFADPANGRSALEFARLRGHTEPEVWARMPDAMRVGGGQVGPDQGSFENDSIDYRVRHVFGGARLVNTGGRKSTVASNGSDSS